MCSMSQCSREDLMDRDRGAQAVCLLFFFENGLFNSLVRGAPDAATRLIIPNALRKFSSKEACLLGHVLILFLPIQFVNWFTGLKFKM